MAYPNAKIEARRKVRAAADALNINSLHDWEVAAYLQKARELVAALEALAKEIEVDQ